MNVINRTRPGKLGNTAIPVPKIIIDVKDSSGNPANNFIQMSRVDLSGSVDAARANGSVFIGVQWDISDKDKVEWLKHQPMIFMHTKRGVYPSRRQSTRKINNEDITHIPNIPSSSVVGTGVWGQKIQIEPLHRVGSNYGSGHFWWNGANSGGATPNFESEWDFASVQPGHYEILKINPFNFLSGLNTATLPISYVDAMGDNKYWFYMHSKKYQGKNEPHTRIPLYFTFAYIDPKDGKSVIQSEYSEPIYLYLKSQELEKPNPQDPGDRYLIDWIISHK